MVSREENDSFKEKGMQFESSTKRIQEYIDSGKKFKIPAFQRGYSWTGKDVIKLINDAVTQREMGHFIGAFIIANQKNGESIVVDGQQRLTSLLLIMCAIRDWKYKNSGEEACESDEDYKEIKRFVYRRLIDSNLGVEQTKDRDILFAGIRKSKQWTNLFENTVTKKYKGDNKMLIAYREAYNYIEKECRLNPEFIQTVYLSIKDLIFTEISSKRPADAYYVFRSLNSSGVPLRVNDHIKAHIFSFLDADEENCHNQEIDTDESDINTWKSIERNVRYSLDKNSIDTFMKNFALVNGLKSENSRNVYETYFDNITSIEDAQKYIEMLEKDSIIYNSIVKPKGISVEDNYKSVSIDLEFMRSIGIKQHVCLVYAAYKLEKMGRMNINQLVKLIDFLARFHFIYNKLGRQPTNRLTQIYKKYSTRFSELILDNEDPNGMSKSDSLVNELIEKLKEKLYDNNCSIINTAREKFSGLDYESRKNNQEDKKYIKYVLEKVYKDGNSSVINPTLEHVVPQSEGLKSEYGSQINKVGNIILLEYEDNQELKDKDVKYKVDKYYEFGYIPKSLISIVYNFTIENNWEEYLSSLSNEIFELFIPFIPRNMQKYKRKNNSSGARETIQEWVNHRNRYALSGSDHHLRKMKSCISNTFMDGKKDFKFIKDVNRNNSRYNCLSGYDLEIKFNECTKFTSENGESFCVWNVNLREIGGKGIFSSELYQSMTSRLNGEYDFELKFNGHVWKIVKYKKVVDDIK